MKRKTASSTEIEEIKKKAELSESELQNASGRCGDDSDYDTSMICGECGDKRKWHGRYCNGEVYDCPECGAHALVGYEEKRSNHR